MNATKRLAIRFEDYPNERSRWAVPIRGQVEGQLEELKGNLLGPEVEQASDPQLVQQLSWAAHEATALAWFTPYPMLVLPALLEEKVSLARKRWEKQAQVRSR